VFCNNVDVSKFLRGYFREFCTFESLSEAILMLDYNEVNFPCVLCRRDAKSYIVREVDDTNTVLKSNWITSDWIRLACES